MSFNSFQNNQNLQLPYTNNQLMMPKVTALATTVFPPPPPPPFIFPPNCLPQLPICIPTYTSPYTDISLCVPSTITFNGAVTSVTVTFTSSACGTFIYTNGTTVPFTSTLNIAPATNAFSSKIVKTVPDTITVTFDTFTYLSQSYTPAVITLDQSTTNTAITTVLTGTAGGSITLIVIYIFCGTNWTINDILFYPN